MDEKEEDINEEFLVVIELYGLQFSKSLNLKYKNQKIYIFPNNYFEFISQVKKEINFLKSPEYENQLSVRFKKPMFFETGSDKRSLIITTFNLNIEINFDEIVNKIIEFYNFFLRINSVLFNYLLNISKIFIFLKENIFYKLQRVISRKILENELQSRINLYEFRDYKKKIELMLRRAEESDLNREIILLFFELIYAKKANNIEIKVIYLWNFLEHIANIYNKNKNKNLLINSKKFNNLKKKISEIISVSFKNVSTFEMIINHQHLKDEINRVINELNKKLGLSKDSLRTLKKLVQKEIKSYIDKSDILINGFNKEKICELLTFQIANFPSILTLIELMLEDINYQLTETDRNIIFYINKARNFYFHNSLKTGECCRILRELINQKEGSELMHFTLSDFSKLVSNFENLVENITFHILNFPSDLKIKRSTHSIEWRAFNQSLYPHHTPESYFTEFFNSILIEFIDTKKYDNLLRFVLRLSRNYSINIKKNVWGGFLYSLQNENYQRKSNILFLDDFSARLTIKGSFSLSEVTFGILIFLKNRKLSFDSILSFNAFTDITFLPEQLSFETFLLDFKINAELNASKNLSLYSKLKDSLSPLPREFLREKYYRDYYKFPEEFQIVYDQLPIELKNNCPNIILQLTNIEEIKRFKNIIGLKNIKIERINNNTKVYFDRYLGEQSEEQDTTLWTTQESILIKESQEFLFYFPFLDEQGILFITNSPKQFLINQLLLYDFYKWTTEYKKYFVILHFLVKLLYDIEKGKKIEKSSIEQLNNMKESESLNLTINEPNVIINTKKFTTQFISLISKISIFPRISSIIDLTEEINVLRDKDIVPYLENDFKGVSWLSFALTVVSYSLILEDNSFIENINEERRNQLMNICKNVYSINLNLDFIQEFITFIEEFIISVQSS